MTNPMVSIVMITYGHQNYIKQAIEGVLNQKCHFDIELIISNDCSPDTTDIVIQKIIKEDPRASIIKYFKHDSNIGMMPNFIWALGKAEGKYIATCEGDDYWVNPNKLQMQVDFLEANLDYTFSMGRVDDLNQNTGKTSKGRAPLNISKKDFFTLKDYIKNPFSQTSSFVFRNSKKSFPDWFYMVHAGDQSLVVIKTGVLGKIKYHNELLSVYRVNNASVSFVIDKELSKQKEIFLLNQINEFTGFRFKRIILKRKIINQLIYYSRSKNRIVRYFGLVFYLFILKL